MKKIKISTQNVTMNAELNDSATADLIYNGLPIEARVSTWGDEIYFTIPVKTGLENGVDIVQKGDLGYWPQGNCFCIFFGKTPMSIGEEIRPASAVNLVGKILGDPEDWKKVAAGENISVKKLEE